MNSARQLWVGTLSIVLGATIGTQTIHADQLTQANQRVSKTKKQYQIAKADYTKKNNTAKKQKAIYQGVVKQHKQVDQQYRQQKKVVTAENKRVQQYKISITKQQTYVNQQVKKINTLTTELNLLNTTQKTAEKNATQAKKLFVAAQTAYIELLEAKEAVSEKQAIYNHIQQSGNSQDVLMAKKQLEVALNDEKTASGVFKQIDEIKSDDGQIYSVYFDHDSLIEKDNELRIRITNTQENIAKVNNNRRYAKAELARTEVNLTNAKKQVTLVQNKQKQIHKKVTQRVKESNIAKKRYENAMAARKKSAQIVAKQKSAYNKAIKQRDSIKAKRLAAQRKAAAKKKQQAHLIHTAKTQRIVGNSRSKIYHMPYQAGYRMSSKNVVYFNSEAQAQAAGYRKSLR